MPFFESLIPENVSLDNLCSFCETYVRLSVFLREIMYTHVNYGKERNAERGNYKKCEDKKFEHDIPLSKLVVFEKRVRASPQYLQAIALDVFLRHEEEEE